MSKTYDNYICFTSSPRRDPIHWMSQSGNLGAWTRLARQYFAAIADYWSDLTNRCCRLNVNCTMQAYFKPPAVYDCVIFARGALKTAFPVPSPGNIPACTSNPSFAGSVNLTRATECQNLLDDFVTGEAGVVEHCSDLEGELTTFGGVVVYSSAAQVGLVIALFLIGLAVVLNFGLCSFVCATIRDRRTRRRSGSDDF